MGAWFALAALAACLAAGAGCVTHTTPGGTDVDPPTQADILAERETSVAAVPGLAFTLRYATLTIPRGSLEFDAMLHFALCRPTALPDDVPIPAGERALLAVYAMTDVRVDGTWPLHLQLISDFQDATPFDPGFHAYKLDPDAKTYVPITGAVVTPTSVSLGMLPGYVLVTVAATAPYATDLLGSTTRTEVAFPSLMATGVENAFGLLGDGTDFVRLSNSLAAGHRDRPYVARDGTRVAIVRDGGSGPARLFATTPSSPQGNLTLVAQSKPGWPMGDVSFSTTSVTALVPGLLDVTGAKDPGVFVVQLVGGDEPQQVYQEPVQAAPLSVACSPDGTHAAIATSRYFPYSALAGTYDVAIIDLAAGLEQEPVRLTATLHPGAEPSLTVGAVSWSPDGWITFGATVGGEPRIYRVAADGSQLVEIEALRGCRYPASSADGTALLCEQSGSLVRYALADGTTQLVGPPANGYGSALVADRTTKVSWLGR
jgi:hypothetical protein